MLVGTLVMFEEYYGLNEKPFAVQPDPAFLFLSDKHKQTLSRLKYSMLNRAGFTVITGGIGSGKTTLIRELMHNIEENIAVGLVSNVNFSSFTELLQWILYSFELDYKGKDKVSLFETFTDFVIENYSEGRRTVLIIDEAQNLDPEALEQLRMLLNINVDHHQVLQLILVGQLELQETLRRPELEQFVQRVEVDFTLEPLNMAETRQYVEHRLQVAGGGKDLFTADTYPAIWRSTSGIPRLINILCGMAITYGFADFKDHIDIDVINAVIEDKKNGFSQLEDTGFSGSGSQIVGLATNNGHPTAISASTGLDDQSNKKNQKNLSTIEKLFLLNKE